MPLVILLEGTGGLSKYQQMATVGGPHRAFIIPLTYEKKQQLAHF